MDENIDAGQLNRRFLHLWLVVSLGPPALPGIGSRRLEDDAPPPAPARQAAPHNADFLIQTRGRRD
jgi:hypothetical protein